MIDTKSLRERAPIREPVFVECLDEIDWLRTEIKCLHESVGRMESRIYDFFCGTGEASAPLLDEFERIKRKRALEER